MRREKIEKIKKDLLDMREQLWIEIKHKQGEAAELRDAGVPDPGDEGTTEDLRDFLHLMSDSKREQILEIDEALDRIQNGTYGICEECGGEIKIKRLEIQPYTRYCVSCKEEIEKRESRISASEQGKI